MKEANLIYELRVKKGIKSKELAEKIGYTQGGLSLLENGKRQPKASIIIKLSNILDCSIAELVNHFAKLEDYNM